jgi:ABC-type sugar transport system permease subunit
MGSRSVVRPRPPWSARVSQSAVLYGFLLPIVVLYAVFSLYPIVETFELSFFDAKIVEQGPFVGLDNYRALLRTRDFMQALGNTVLFTAASTVVALVIALALAVLVSLPWVRGQTFFKVVFFLPVVTSLVAVGYVWKWMLDPSYGVVNATLGLAGVRPGPRWLADPSLALWSLVAVNVWKWIGYFQVIFLANLQAIDPHYYEAAAIDGAGPWRRFLRITLPLLRAFVMTQGGPAGRTELLATYVYREAFGTGQLRFGFSAAASVVLFVMIMAFTVASNRAGRAGEVAL